METNYEGRRKKMTKIRPDIRDVEQAIRLARMLLLIYKEQNLDIDERLAKANINLSKAYQDLIVYQFKKEGKE